MRLTRLVVLLALFASCSARDGRTTRQGMRSGVSVEQSGPAAGYSIDAVTTHATGMASAASAPVLALHRGGPGRSSGPIQTAQAGQVGKLVRFTPDLATPYFRTGAAGEAARRFALEDWKAARTSFAVHLTARRSDLDGASKARIRLLMAIADTHLGHWDRAAAGFEYAAARLPLIADYILYHAARARFFAHQPEASMGHARAVATDSIVGDDALLLIGDLLRIDKNYPAMIRHYARYLAEQGRGTRRAEARYRLARAYEETGKAVPHAFDLYRQITIESPLSEWGKRAKERFDSLLATMEPDQRKPLATLSADELIERGMVYYRAMRNPLSEADFARALGAPGLTVANRCVAAYHRANSVFKARNRKRASTLFDDAITACKQASNIDLQVKASYQAGRSYAFIGEHDVAIDRYRQAETVSSTHTYVDDARLRQAEEYAELGDDRKVTEVLASIPKLYPHGDMRAEATWRLGWRAYRDGEYQRAIRWFRKQIEIMPIDHNYWAEGQAQYWMGRAQARLKRKRQAAASYREAAMRYPLSYYALLALNRLRAEHPARFKAVVAEIGSVPGLNSVGSDKRIAPLQFKPRAVYGSPGFARAVEFIRLGLGQPAEAEMRRIGLNIPPGKRPVTDPERIEKIWATAFLYDRARRYSQSHWPTRWHLLEYKRTWPVAGNRERWHIAYPKSHWNLVAQHATEHGFPRELLMAIVREESAFDPLRESYANAIGLTQMLFPTARRFGKGTGIAITRENLRDPEKNVTIGSRFLGFLWAKWQKHVMLVPPSYNAGEGAVSRWLRERGKLAADEWIEAIKGDQARRYSKRVLASYFAYSYLYRNQIPEISFHIPKKLIPKKKQAAKPKARTKKAREVKKSRKKNSARKETQKNKAD